METTGKQFVEFWSWASSKGLMNENTAKGIAAPVRQVLSIDENWETQDVSNIDADELLQRFQNVRGKDFKPESLNAYARRFKQALDLFLQYTRDPSGWKFKGKISSNRKPKAEKSDKQLNLQVSEDIDKATLPQAGNLLPLMEYPFPLRDNCIVKIKLPTDLKVAEVERLTLFIRTLALDFNPSQGL